MSSEASGDGKNRNDEENKKNIDKKLIGKTTPIGIVKTQQNNVEISQSVGGTLYGTTPGGTRIKYDKDHLMYLRFSPQSKTPPRNFPVIPGVTKKNLEDNKPFLEMSETQVLNGVEDPNFMANGNSIANGKKKAGEDILQSGNTHPATSSSVTSGKDGMLLFYYFKTLFFIYDFSFSV